MRKMITICITVLFAMAIYADDACHSIYINALKAYNSGDYIEAQRKFIIVAQTCGDYQEVYKKLRDCNTKLKEKQTAYANEISTLKENNRKLTDQYNSQKSEFRDSQNRSTSRITSLEIKLKKDSVQLDSVNYVLNDTITKLDSTRNRIKKLELDSALLRQELDSVTHLKDSLQEELNRLNRRKNNKVTVRDDDAKLNTENSIEIQKTEGEDNGSRNTEGTPEENNQTPAKQEEPSEVEQEQKK